MQQHVTILSWIYIIFGVLGILGGFGLLFVMLGAGALAHDRQALLATGIVGFVIAGVLVVLSLPSLLAGWGLTKRREWARILAIILGVIHLLAFPVGTAIGAYTLWALLNDQKSMYMPFSSLTAVAPDWCAFCPQRKSE